MKKTILILTLFWLFSGEVTYAHCQVPCGIYDDHARIVAMLEDVSTVEKAIDEMKVLEDEKGLQSQNQMIRWTMNKEKHADNIISTISDYFLTQRVKGDQKDYEQRLVDHHRVIVGAMKVKQNTNQKYVKELKEDILKLEKYYPEHRH